MLTPTTGPSFRFRSGVTSAWPRSTDAAALKRLAKKRIHSGEKPYSCRDCDYRTASASNVRKHERRKHNL